MVALFLFLVFILGLILVTNGYSLIKPTSLNTELFRCILKEDALHLEKYCTISHGCRKQEDDLKIYNLKNGVSGILQLCCASSLVPQIRYDLLLVRHAVLYIWWVQLLLIPKNNLGREEGFQKPHKYGGIFEKGNFKAQTFSDCVLFFRI